MDFLKNFIKSRNIAFYIACFVGVLSFVTGIVALAALSFAGATALPLVLALIGLIAFLALSLVGYERLGAACMGAFTFGAFLVTLMEVYEHFLDVVQNQAMGGFDLGAVEGLPALIVCVILFVVCAVAANVLAWVRLRKKDSPAAWYAA